MNLKSNEPFWLVKNGIITSYSSLHEDKTCDVLVVGGGITGSLAAFQSIKDGYSTILIDKREIANGSSSATTSMLQYEIDTPLYKLTEMIGEKGAAASYHACADAIDRLRAIAGEIQSKAGFKKKKSLYFAAFKKDIPELEKEFVARKKAGFDVKWLTGKQISSRFGIEKTFGGILSAQGASVDAFRLVHEILEFCTKKGLEVYDRTELTEVIHKGRSNEILLNTGATIRAKKIIYCVGYESEMMIPEKFVDLISTYAVASEVEPALHRKFKDILIWNTAVPYIYMRTTDDGRMLVGGGDEEFRNPQKRDALIGKKEKKLLKSFRKYIPSEEFYPDFSWAGNFGETKDGLPYIGTHRKFPDSYFILGFGGNGITFSVTGMSMMADWLKGKKHPLTRWFQFGR